jgi:hypothetical protein
MILELLSWICLWSLYDYISTHLPAVSWAWCFPPRVKGSLLHGFRFVGSGGTIPTWSYRNLKHACQPKSSSSWSIQKPTQPPTTAVSPPHSTTTPCVPSSYSRTASGSSLTISRSINSCNYHHPSSRDYTHPKKSCSCPITASIVQSPSLFINSTHLNDHSPPPYGTNSIPSPSI